MKKKTLLLTIVATLSLLFIAACSNNSKEEKKYFDEQFVTALAKGLESRWQYTDTTKDDQDSKKWYKNAIKKELDSIEEYQDKSFKDSKLKEAAIAYINSLKETDKVADTFGATDFYNDWDKAYETRTAKLIAINDISKIKVSEKYQDNLDEVLSSGKSVQQDTNNKQKITDLFKNVTFTKDETKSDEYSSYYYTTVQNTTGLTIKHLTLSVKFIDDQGVTVEQTYLNPTDNWAKDETKRLEFMVPSDKAFTKTEVVSDYFDFDE